MGSLLPRLQSFTLTAVFALGPCLALASLDPTRPMTQYVLDTWQAQEGMPQAVIRSILQTSDGYLWLGTPAGVVRFDGLAFENFGRRAFADLPSDYVTCLMEGPDGDLWAGFSNGGVHRLREGKWEPVGESAGLRRETIATLFLHSDGTVWVAAQRGLFTVRGDRVEKLDHGALSHARVRAVAEDAAGRLWFGTMDSGIVRLDAGETRDFRIADGLPSDNITALIADPDGLIWAATNPGELVVIREDTVVATRRIEGSVSRPFVRALLRDRAGTIWVGTHGGLSRIVDGTLTRFDERQGLVDRRVLDFLEDREGNLWIATYGGLARFKNPRLLSFGAQEGLAHDDARSVFETEDGDVLVSTVAGIARQSGASFEILPETRGESWPTLGPILEDGSGTLWVGGYGGVFRYRDAWSHLGIAAGLPNLRAMALFEDDDGVLWVGTASGPRTWRGNRFVAPAGAEALEGSEVNVFHQDRSGVLWVGTRLGLFARRHAIFEAVPLGEHLNAWVRYIHEDSHGILWIGTGATGLFRYREGQVTQYTVNQGLPDDSVWMILESEPTATMPLTFWMCSDLGIFSVAKSELESVANGSQLRVHARVYGAADGMKNRECNGVTQPSGLRSRDGHLWFPTAGGVVEIDPEVVSAERTYVPPVKIQSVLVDGVPLATGEGFTVEGGSHQLEFRFAALEFTDPERMRFRYRLEGYDDGWIDIGARRWAHYANLPPGDYRFAVNAGTKSSWHEPIASLEFTYAPLWYQTRAFIVASAVAFGLSLLGGSRLWAIRLRKQRLVLEERVRARALAEEEQRRAKEHWLSIYDNATVGIFSGTRDGRFIDVNPALVEMLGYASAEELLAVDRYAVYREADQHADLIDSHTDGNSFRNVEVEWRAKGGAPIIVRLNGRALPRQAPPVYVTIAQDITEERALEEQLRHKHKMEAVGQLAGGVAHDFNNLLTVILGRAESLIHKNGGEEEEPVEAREILMAGERAAALTQQLLAFSRKNVTEPRRVDVNDVVRGVEPMLWNLLGDDHTVVVEPAENLGTVLADPGNLELALVNLVLNARDAMPDGGAIVVRTRNREVADDNHSGARPGAYVSMSVADRGVGMDEETRRRLFEPFFTTKPIGKGTGLGLAIVYGTVRQIGGYIGVRSSEEAGTVFELLLPRVEGAPERETVRAEENLPASRDQTVLVVEDEDAVRDILVAALEHSGYTVIVAACPERALQLGHDHRGAIDLLVTDVMMPTMNGTQLAERLKEASPGLRVLFISGYADDVLSREHVRGQSTFLAKPFTSRELVSCVADVLDA